MASGAVRPCGYAATAAEFLDAAAEDGDSFAALQGIGYAVLAVVDQLADANDAAAGSRDQLAGIAMAIGGPAREFCGWRVLGAFGRLVRLARLRSALRCVRRVGVAGLLEGICGPGKGVLARYADQWAREHPGALVSVHDPEDRDVMGGDQCGQVVPLDVLLRPARVVLLGSDARVVRQALADAAAWRAWKAEGVGCANCERLDPGRCAEHAADEELAAAYEAVGARLSGGVR